VELLNLIDMMRIPFLIFSFIIISINLSFLSAQPLTIKGEVMDKNANPVSFANISLEGTIDGTNSDENGYFEFETETSGIVILRVTMMGYEEYREETNITDNKYFKIILKPVSKELNEVTVTASSYILKGNLDMGSKNAVDLVTTAGSEGDIYKSLSTLPGTQVAGTDGKLLVRGGDSRESQTYIDDMHLLNAYTSMPENVGARSRYSPFLFEGISFSMGGYSSEYSQGLSSVLPLMTKDESRISKLGASILSVGVGGGGTKSWTKSSASFNFDYTNMAPYNSLLHPDEKKNWNKQFEVFAGQNQLRFQLNDNTILKTYFAYDRTRFDQKIQDSFYDNKRNLVFDEDNLYLNTTLRSKSFYGMKVFSGIAFSLNNKKMNGGLVADDRVKMKEYELHLKLKAEKRFSNIYKLGMGVEALIKNYDFLYRDTTSFTKDINHSFGGMYVSNDFILTPDLYLNVSSRLEYTALNKKWNILPRIALNYNIDGFIFSGAYGKYQQQADRDYLLYNSNLSSADCQHMVLGLHYQSNEKTYRVELYHKKYDKLVTIRDRIYSDSGRGFSNGIDIFLNNRKFLTNWEYMISYSYNNSKRKYLDFEGLETPSYSTKHNAAISLKYNLLKYRTFIGITNRFASGRPYHNPNKPGQMNAETSPYNSLDICVTFLAHKRLIVHASASNILNRENIFGYRYTSQSDTNGNYSRMPVTQYHKQFFVIGFFFTLGGKAAYDVSNF